MARKTVDVEDLLVACNNVLALPDETLTREPAPITSDPVSYRQGLMGVIEQVLRMADRYKGFRYLPTEFSDGMPGVELREGYDETRRQYF